MTEPRQRSSLKLLAGAVGAAVLVHLAFLGGLELYRKWFPWVPPPEEQEMEVVWIEDTSNLAKLDLPELEEVAIAEEAPKPEEPEKAVVEKRESEEKREKDKKKKLEKDRKKVEVPKPELVRKPEPPKPEPKKLEPKKVEPPKPVVAKKSDPPKPVPPPKPPEKKKEEVAKKQPLPKMDRKKMVEVDDEKNVVDETNYEATYFSDKNRKVSVESRDTQSNLEKQLKGKGAASAPSPDTTSEEIGGKEDKIRQNEEAEQTSLQASRRDPPTAHNGDAMKAKGVRVGDQGQGGDGGKNGGGGDGGKPGALAMRNIEGKGAPGQGPRPNATMGGADDAPLVSMNQDPGAPIGDGKGGAPGRSGKRGKRGPKLNLEQKDYARIVGNDKVKQEERQVASRSKSHRRGRWEKKLEGIRSSLENFTPEVKPGNQTALGTRAHPFALYIAKMHRNIHELWGFGFLEDLDRRGASNPMNERTLAVTMEIVIAGDGSVEKVTIVKPSGVLTFDVAAIDTVMSAGPYDPPKQEIQSGDGKVYMHWTFHRDERQCTPYFADPFILDNEKTEANGAVVKRGLPDPTDEVLRRKREKPETLTRGKEGGETDGDVTVPTMTQEQREEIAKRANENPDVERAVNNAPRPDDPAAESTALAWADAFEKGDVGGLVASSTTPFRSGGTTVASDEAALAKIWNHVLGEASRRDIKEWRLFSAAGYRAVFGRLPAGGEDGSPRLYLVVKFGGEQLTLDVIRDANGVYRVNGLTR